MTMMEDLLNAERGNPVVKPSAKDRTYSDAESDSSETLEALVEEKEGADSSRINSVFAQSVLERVIHSWELIAVHKEDVGIDFFTRVLMENPNLLQLFPFGPDLVGRPAEEVRACPDLKKHAIGVMNFIGRGIRGLGNIESLIPDLRALGKTHVTAGVSSSHYDMFYRNLMAAFAAKLGKKWNKETADAWANVYNGMTTVMDSPEQLDQTEPMTGWGLALAISSAFVAFGAPFRLAGFATPFRPVLIFLLDFLDLLAAAVLACDMISSHIVRRLKFKKKTRTSRTPSAASTNLSIWRDKLAHYKTSLKFRIFRTIYFLRLERWVPWPRLDAAILFSYLIQNLNRWNRMSTLYDTQAGVSWVHAVGLVRALAVLRVFYFARCAENGIILKRSTSEHWRRVASISHLVFTLVYVTHVSACLWCIVARIELGSTATEATASEFFPDPDILLGKSGALKAYLVSVYWAWVNLAGTGNVESAPSQPLEIFATLMVHVCGATLYAIATGHVVTILEQLTQKENQVGNDLSALRSFMDECEMTTGAQDRIMHGYIAQNLMRSNDDLSVPDLNDDVGRKLPPHFRLDLELHARAVALQRRNHFFQECSLDLLFALASEMRHTRKLLAGDYLFQEGEMVPRRFRMVERGTLEIIKGDESIGALERGCSIGFGWLVDATLPTESRISFSEPSEFSDWLLESGEAGVSIRATSECIIASGLPSPLEIEALQRRFPVDFDVLEDQRKAEANRVQKNRRFRGVVRAAIVLNQHKKKKV